MDLERIVAEGNRFDRRLVDRFVDRGVLSKDALDRYLEALPDQSGKFDEIPVDDSLLFGRTRRSSLRAAARSEDETID